MKAILIITIMMLITVKTEAQEGLYQFKAYKVITKDGIFNTNETIFYNTYNQTLIIKNKDSFIERFKYITHVFDEKKNVLFMIAQDSENVLTDICFYSQDGEIRISLEQGDIYRIYIINEKKKL